MRLVVVHYHLRPGGVRRVIELAVPALLQAPHSPFDRVQLLAGEATDAGWNKSFRASLAPHPVDFFQLADLNYFSERPKSTSASLERELTRLIPAGEAAVIWAHNLSVGRNLRALRALDQFCRNRKLLLLHHHHDWWFDNRWSRWREFRQQSVTRLAEVERLLFAPSLNTGHITINQSDQRILSRFRPGAAWMPNPLGFSGQMLPGPGNQIRTRRAIDPEEPLWLMPCRVLRRKNIAEAVLMARWLRPEARVATTAGPSSAAETPYAQALQQEARVQKWKLTLGLLQGNRNPSALSETIERSEVILVTSLLEGFGLPLIEASLEKKPLIARVLPNVLPDLTELGFKFPQLYPDLLIDPGVFDYEAEIKRQERLYRAWRRGIPRHLHRWIGRPALLTVRPGEAVPFSRLTLTAQLEVLGQPPDYSWKECRRWNPRLPGWKELAAGQELAPARASRAALQALAPARYAQQFLHEVKKPRRKAPATGVKILTAFFKQRFHSANLFPLLWSETT